MLFLHSYLCFYLQNIFLQKTKSDMTFCFVFDYRDYMGLCGSEAEQYRQLKLLVKASLKHITLLQQKLAFSPEGSNWTRISVSWSSLINEFYLVQKRPLRFTLQLSKDLLDLLHLVVIQILVFLLYS